MGKKSGSVSRIRNEQLRSHFRELRNPISWVKILKFFDADPGWKKFESGMKKVGSGINILDPQHCLHFLLFLLNRYRTFLLFFGHQLPGPRSVFGFSNNSGSGYKIKLWIRNTGENEKIRFFAHK
jgi:hypothetical protein